MSENDIDFVSKKIKEIRTRKKMTLKNISEKTDLSVSFLSQMERGRCSMTLVSLRKIADALGVSMNELFTVDEENRYINRADSQVQQQLGHYKHFVRLSGKFPGRKLEGLMVVIEPKLENREESSHEGEEFYYIIKGCGVFILDDEEHYVKEGESIHFPSYIRHKIINREDVDLVMVCVTTPTIF